jgi:AAHS family 4-hydroxybenzoate transporter-like MFS transporter
MAQPETIDVTAFIDERRMTSFNVKVATLLTLVGLVNGFHIMIAAFSGPALIKAWGIENMAVLGPIFSANLAGIFFGSPGFGYIGDRWGRKSALVLACLILAVFAFAGIWATSIPQLIVYRFIAGLGMGGVFPLAIALSTEFAPKKLRATMVGIFFFGQTFGSGTPVAVSLWLVPTYGWQSFYIVGGISATVALILTALWVPESIKFLVLKGGTLRGQQRC